MRLLRTCTVMLNKPLWLVVFQAESLLLDGSKETNIIVSHSLELSDISGIVNR